MIFACSHANTEFAVMCIIGTSIWYYNIWNLSFVIEHRAVSIDLWKFISKLIDVLIGRTLSNEK